MKCGEFIIIVDSVETAVKFYTEKLAFEIVELQASDCDLQTLGFARLRKGKCSITFRRPLVEELAEFSFIKRCMSRCVNLSIEIKNDIYKIYNRCHKQDIKITQDLKASSEGNQSFTLRDPFGIKITFKQTKNATTKIIPQKFFDLPLSKKNLIQPNVKIQEHPLLDPMIEQLKQFGILRRSAKKYSKSKLKLFTQLLAE